VNKHELALRRACELLAISTPYEVECPALLSGNREWVPWKEECRLLCRKKSRIRKDLAPRCWEEFFLLEATKASPGGEQE